MDPGTGLILEVRLPWSHDKGLSRLQEVGRTAHQEKVGSRTGHVWIGLCGYTESATLAVASSL